MAYAGTEKFEQRVSRIETQRRAIKKGAIYSVNHDGLIVARPRRRGLRRPTHFIGFALIGVILFKAALFAHLGAATYQSRVDQLASGTIVERAGAWVMSADTVTQWLATQVKMALL